MTILLSFFTWSNCESESVELVTITSHKWLRLFISRPILPCRFPSSRIQFMKLSTRYISESVDIIFRFTLHMKLWILDGCYHLYFLVQWITGMFTVPFSRAKANPFSISGSCSVNPKRILSCSAEENDCH